MKKTIIALMLIITSSTLCIAGSLIPKEKRVILKDAANITATWLPSNDDTEKALDAINSFLKNSEEHREYNDWTKNEIKKINKNIDKYRVQFVGKIINGKKRIYCNFFPDHEGDFTYWKKSLVFVFDGGFWFWQIEYDIETGKCLNFSSNGYA